MKAFVTGSTGLLGINLVQQLVQNGWEVKALARSREKAMKFLDTRRVEVVVGDMEDVGAFAPALAGCDVLFHTAAYFRDYFSPAAAEEHWRQLKRINVDATIELLSAAEQYGVKKTIYVSSSTVIGVKPDGRPGDETTDFRDPEHNLYARSKILAEQTINDWLKSHPMPVVMILPTAIFGPGDAGPTGAGQMVLDFLARKLPAIPPGGFSVVDVRDVAQAMLKAVEVGKSGERYIVDNTYYSVADIMRLLSEITGIPTPQLHMSYPVAMAFARFSETAARLTRTRAQVTVNAIRTLNARFLVESDRARRELGVTPRPFAETLRDMVAWYQQHNYIGAGQR